MWMVTGGGEHALAKIRATRLEQENAASFGGEVWGAS